MIEEMPRELRLRELARRVIADYRAGVVTLRRLVNDLDSIWTNLEPSNWKEEFRGHWWTLEQVYSVALDRNQLNELPADAIEDIEEALNNLDALLA